MAAVPAPPLPTLVPPRPDPRWPLLDVSASEFWAFALAPFGIVMLAYFLVLGYLHADGPAGGLAVTAIQQLALAVPLAAWVRRRTGSLAALGLRRAGWSGRDVGVGVGIGALTLIGSLIVLAITVAVVEQLTGHPYVYPSDPLTEGAWFWPFAAMAVFVAPICEEIYFRGFLFQGLRQWTGFGWSALSSGAVFAFVHVEPIRFVSLWMAGVLFAEVFERRKTLVVNICAHAALNAIAIAIAIAGR
jgi:membrane protease YdiL (CAAX protease family)